MGTSPCTPGSRQAGSVRLILSPDQEKPVVRPDRSRDPSSRGRADDKQTCSPMWAKLPTDRIVKADRTDGKEEAHQRTSQAPEHRVLHRHAGRPRRPRFPQGRGERDPPHPPRRQVGHRPTQASGRMGCPLQPSLGQEAHGRKGREQGVQVAHRQQRADMRRSPLLPPSRRPQVVVLQVVLRPFSPREMTQVGDHQADACRQAPSRPVAKDGLEVS